MIKRLICRLFGHKWGEWTLEDGVFFSGGSRACERCKKFDVRRNFIKNVAVGTTYHIRMPERWTVRNEPHS